MSINRFLVAAMAVSSVLLPSSVLADSGNSYNLAVDSEQKNSSIVLYEYDESSKTFKKLYNDLSLKKTTYGTGDSSYSTNIQLPVDKSQQINVNYSTSNQLTRKTTFSTDEEISGNFIQNKLTNSSSDNNGASISNTNTTIKSIVGDFVGNNIEFTNDVKTMGRAAGIYNSAVINSINANFINNTVVIDNTTTSSFAQGAAIYTDTANNYIGEINGNFIGNKVFVKTTTGGLSSDGGAIYHSAGTIGSITGDFIGNTAMAQSDNSSISVHAGALYTSAHIETFTGNFIGNSVIGKTQNLLYVQGGVIYSRYGSFGEIKGDFINNYVIGESENGPIYAEGGAIYSFNTKEGNTIDSITGDFIGNYIKVSGAKNINAIGGALCNTGGVIGTLTGGFINNYIIASGNEDITISGGAVHNSHSIPALNGSFYSNYLTATATTGNSTASGGALYNYGDHTTINADFVGNSVSSQSNSGIATAQGGAIFAADSSTVDIKGKLEQNKVYAQSETGKAVALGGAVYATEGGTINLYDSFIDNSAVAESTSGEVVAHGGAVANFGGTVNILANNNDIEFTNNTANGLSNAIHNESGVVNLQTSGDYSILFNDAISGNAGVINVLGTVNIDNIISNNIINLKSGSLNLLNSGTFDNTTSLVFDGGSLNVIDNTIKEYTLNSLTYNNGSFGFDLDLTNNLADKFVVNSSSGLIDLSNLNLVDYTLGEGQIQIIDGSNIASTFKEFTLFTPEGKIVFTNGEAGYIKYDALDTTSNTLENAIRFETAERVYQMENDEQFTRNNNDLLDGNMTVNANGNTIDGNGHHGINVGENNKLNINNAVVNNFAGESFIQNDGIVGNVSGEFENNSAEFGGVITNSNIINVLEGVYKNNTADYMGGVLYNNSGIVNVIANSVNTEFTGNTANGKSNAFDNIGGIINFNANDNMQIVINDSIGISQADFVDAYLKQNPSVNEQIAIQEFEKVANVDYNFININPSKADLELSVKNYLLKNKNLTIDDYNSMSDTDKQNFDNEVSELIEQTQVPSYHSGLIELNNKVSNNTVNMFDGTLKFGSNKQNDSEYFGTFDSDVKFNYYGGQITLQNDDINSANLGNVALYSDMKLSLDADLADEFIDTISVDSIAFNDNKIEITNVNLLSKTDKKYLSLSPLSQNMNSALREELAKNIFYSGGDVAYSPMYKYQVDYDPTTAMLNFGLKDFGKSISDFNPNILGSVIAVQVGGLTTQLDSYDEAFRNMDMFMLMPEKERTAFKYLNKYASLDGGISYNNIISPYQNNSGWFRPHATFEKVDLKRGPEVSNVSYGTYFGYDSALTELGNGWDGVLGLYAGYNGSHQTFQGNSIYQNGGNVGVVGFAYKGKFYTGFTANIGASIGDLSTSQGKDDITMMMGGIASKSGYNFEFADGKFILQPNAILSYSIIDTFDYTNSQGINMKSDALQNLHIEPGLKFIGNLGTWQPYASVSVVFNVMDKSKFKANDVVLPDVSVKPYVKYGVGLQKKWHEKFTAYLQAFVTNGGRNGVGLRAGFKMALGEDNSKKKFEIKNPFKKKTKLTLNNSK